jgi:hypothetical protein
MEHSKTISAIITPIVSLFVITSPLSTFADNSSRSFVSSFFGLDLMGLRKEADGLRKVRDQTNKQIENIRQQAAKDQATLNKDVNTFSDLEKEFINFKTAAKQIIAADSAKLEDTIHTQKKQKLTTITILNQAKRLQVQIAEATTTHTELSSAVAATASLVSILKNYSVKKELWIAALDKVVKTSQMTANQYIAAESLRHHFMQWNGSTRLPQHILDLFSSSLNELGVTVNSGLMHELNNQISEFIGTLEIEIQLLDAMIARSQSLRELQSEMTANLN